MVDNYVNTKTLQLLSQKQEGVEIVIFTENGHGKKGFLSTAVVNDFTRISSAQNKTECRLP